MRPPVSMRLRRISLTAGLTAVVALAVASNAVSAGSPPSPWNGANPFNCTIQDAGFGTTVPDPGADPYCVYFDKTNQNITQLGLVTFLTKEPARSAAAVPKCFYFQEDHWRGSAVQSNGKTVVYEFEGHYYFNKATGDGGAWVTGFTVAGQEFDPTEIPGFPPGYGQYFGPGTGGMTTHDDFPADPTCAAIAERDPSAVYAAAASTGTQCIAGGGPVDGHGLGPVALGATEQTVRGEIGAPGAVKRGFLRYCVRGGGSLLVGERGDRSGAFGAGGDAPAVMLASTSQSFTLAGRGRRLVRVGSTTRKLHLAFRSARTFGRVGGLYAWRVSGKLVALTRKGHVRALAVYDPRAIRARAALLGYLRRGL